MRKAFFEYMISPDQIENDNRYVPYNDLSFPGILNEFGYGKLVLFEDDESGKHLYLKKVSILNFIFELENALQQLKTVKNGETEITDSYQYFHLFLEKKANLCKIRRKDVLESIFITVEFELLFSNIKSTKNKVFLDFAYFYPSLLVHKDYEQMKAVFGGM